MGMSHVFLVIRVNPFLLLICGLECLHFSVLVLYLSVTSLHCSISQNLLSPLLLQLHGIQLVFLLLLLLHHVCLSDLLSSLISHLVDLALIEPFKVVGLDSMWSQHTDFCGWILSHEVMSHSELNLVGFLIGPLFVLGNLPLFLLLGHDLIDP